MSVERDIRYELIARLCPNATGAELRSVCTEAGMYAIRARRKVATEKDFLEAVNKVIKGYQKFSSTPKVRKRSGKVDEDTDFIYLLVSHVELEFIQVLLLVSLKHSHFTNSTSACYHAICTIVCNMCKSNSM